MNPEQKKREFINAYQSLFANDKKKEMENEAAKLKQALYERQCNLNKNFNWTPENTQKIIELNNGLLERYREAYNELLRVKKKLKNDIVRATRTSKTIRLR